MNRGAHGHDVEDDVSDLLQAQADRLFEHISTRAILAGADSGTFPEESWTELEAAGHPLALASEAAGGLGLPGHAALQLVRRAGYHMLPLPLAEAMLGLKVWGDAGGALPTGVTSIALNAGTPRLHLEPCPGGFLATGTVTAPWGRRADQVLIPATDGAGAIHAVLAAPYAFEVTRMGRNLANEPRDELTFSGALLPPEAVIRLASARDAEDMFVAAALMRSAQMVGAMERALELAVQYAQERVQFGRPIGKFQAVQHSLAVAVGQMAAAAAAVDAAGEGFGDSSSDFLVGVAKARVGEAAGLVASISHQVLGAMGFTREHLLHFATRRLWSWRDEFGSDAYWQRRIGRAACAKGGDAIWPTLTSLRRDGEVDRSVTWFVE
jgi:acyl-CoA dehydrogenase